MAQQFILLALPSTHSSQSVTLAPRDPLTSSGLHRHPHKHGRHPPPTHTHRDMNNEGETVDCVLPEGFPTTDIHDCPTSLHTRRVQAGRSVTDMIAALIPRLCPLHLPAGTRTSALCST